MGRVSREQADENRARILASAARLFRAQGIDGESVADIMRDCGMTVGGFYRHFTSKEDLAAQAVSAVFAQASAAWDKAFEAAGKRNENPVAALVPRYLGNRRAAHRCPLLAFAPHADGDETAAAVAQAYAAGAGRLYEQFIGQAPGAQGDDTDAMVLFAAMIGYRMLEQGAGRTDWVRALEAAINQKSAALDAASTDA